MASSDHGLAIAVLVFAILVFAILVFAILVFGVGLLFLIVLASRAPRWDRPAKPAWEDRYRQICRAHRLTAAQTEQLNTAGAAANWRRTPRARSSPPRRRRRQLINAPAPAHAPRTRVR
jgi:hypothetical protein